MKKIVILLQVMAICLAIFPQSNYSLKFEENDFSFVEMETGCRILSKDAGYYLLSDTTLPALTYKTVYILVPENTDLKNINVSIKSEEKRRNIYLMNNPVVRPTSTINNNANSNNNSYLKDKYPDENVKFVTIVKSQGFYMAAFSVCPFIYHAQNRTLELITEMNISFDYERKASTESINSNVKRYDMEDFVRSLIINPEDINVLYPELKTSPTRSSANDVEYLIITSENLKENFIPLKAWKIRKGIKTEILSTNYIYSNYTGNTNQIKIKKCLKDYYENKNLKWALLGGDDTIIPVQWCYGNFGSYTDYTIPCDLFYSCFDNTFDWNANNNGIIGELDDDIDMATEIYISRVPIRTAEHVNTFVNKTLKYETDLPLSNYVETILLTGDSLSGKYDPLGYLNPSPPQSDTHIMSERMYSDYINPYWPNGIKTKFYDTGTDFPGGASFDFTATNLQSVLNNGYHFVHMVTHGGQTVWQMETGNFYDTTNAQNQTNSNPSIIIDMACFTNAFDNVFEILPTFMVDTGCLPALTDYCIRINNFLETNWYCLSYVYVHFNHTLAGGV